LADQLPYSRFGGRTLLSEPAPYDIVVSDGIASATDGPNFAPQPATRLSMNAAAQQPQQGFGLSTIDPQLVQLAA
jgi:hypothetical protein